MGLPGFSFTSLELRRLWMEETFHETTFDYPSGEDMKALKLSYARDGDFTLTIPKPKVDSSFSIGLEYSAYPTSGSGKMEKRISEVCNLDSFLRKRIAQLAQDFFDEVAT